MQVSILRLKGLNHTRHQSNSEILSWLRHEIPRKQRIPEGVFLDTIKCICVMWLNAYLSLFTLYPAMIYENYTQFLFKLITRRLTVFITLQIDIAHRNLNHLVWQEVEDILLCIYPNFSSFLVFLSLTLRNCEPIIDYLRLFHMFRSEFLLWLIDIAYARTRSSNWQLAGRIFGYTYRIPIIYFEIIGWAAFFSCYYLETSSMLN